MIKLKINNKDIEVPVGTSVLKAAESLGIEIPTMCFNEGFTNHPSCMLCLVKDSKSGQLHPSCALPASNGMEIITDDDEIFNARKEALELLLSDHVGDCEAPCRNACPAFMDIPNMLRLIQQKKYAEALKMVKEEIAIPIILGYICPAPCEKACRRAQLDEAVSICSLKKFVAIDDAENENIYLPSKGSKTGKKVAVIGSGPAGLACAFHLLKMGHDCTIFDKNEKAGGSMFYEIPDEKLPKWAVEKEIEIMKDFGVEFNLGIHITPDYYKNVLKSEYDAVVFATGNFIDSNMNEFPFEYNEHGIIIDKETMALNDSGDFACGNIFRSRRMAVTSVAQGKAAAWSVNLFLENKNPSKKHRKFNSMFGKLKEEEIKEYQKETQPHQRIQMPNGKLDNFSNEQAVQEAERCMHCDCRKPHNCKLRNYSDEYDADKRKFLFGERKKIKKQYQHDIIVYEPEKCIKCNLCVEISAKEKDALGFTNIRRGFNMEINMPYNESIKGLFDETAIKCANMCPTGAISLK